MDPVNPWLSYTHSLSAQLEFWLERYQLTQASMPPF